MGEYQLENLDFKTCQHICDCYSGRVGNNLSFLFATAGRVDLCISCRKFMSRTFFARILKALGTSCLFFPPHECTECRCLCDLCMGYNRGSFRAEILVLVMKPILVVWGKH